MKFLAPAFYELDPDESFTVRIECEGGAYLAFGNVNNFELKFSDTRPDVAVTPAILAGPNSINRVHLHLFYPVDAPSDRYLITVIDEQGQVVDTIQSTLEPNRQRPYRVDVDLIVRVL
jgi:hypothetical protein